MYVSVETQAARGEKQATGPAIIFLISCKARLQAASGSCQADTRVRAQRVAASGEACWYFRLLGLLGWFNVQQQHYIGYIVDGPQDGRLAILCAATHETGRDTMTPVSAAHIILTPTQPVGNAIARIRTRDLLCGKPMFYPWATAPPPPFPVFQARHQHYIGYIVDGPQDGRLTILCAATHETGRGYDSCLSRSHYTDTDPTSRERNRQDSNSGPFASEADVLPLDHRAPQGK
ncbi:hypothetical protein EGW08_012221 [Elysia chlorotica]|uniref:Uncharacterized protein n=1 Tax=Elysia chlorotica TaxID=188477 RepID=A0A3S1BG45_ELYCH|nr:hypothetical protein EGW08_012221 [Elysia chlorotica]